MRWQSSCGSQKTEHVCTVLLFVVVSERSLPLCFRKTDMEGPLQPELSIKDLTSEGLANACASLNVRTGLTFVAEASKPGGAKDRLVTTTPVLRGTMTYDAFGKMNQAGLMNATLKGFNPETGQMAGAADDNHVVITRLSREGAGLGPQPSAPRPRPPQMRMR